MGMHVFIRIEHEMVLLLIRLEKRKKLILIFVVIKLKQFLLRHVIRTSLVSGCYFHHSTFVISFLA